MNHFIGGKSGGSIYYKPIQCPTGYIMTGTRMYGIGDGVDEEHVDAYCCPLIKLQHRKIEACD
ncbi:shufflon protein C' (plasmid) [Escherichia fergusonii]|nr:shufflon protein C' [Escherichia fergusonii]